MKFKKDISVCSELVNRDEILRNVRNMQNIKEINLRMGSEQTSGTNMID